MGTLDGWLWAIMEEQVCAPPVPGTPARTSLAAFLLLHRAGLDAQAKANMLAGVSSAPPPLQKPCVSNGVAGTRQRWGRPTWMMTLLANDEDGQGLEKLDHEERAYLAEQEKIDDALMVIQAQKTTLKEAQWNQRQMKLGRNFFPRRPCRRTAWTHRDAVGMSECVCPNVVPLSFQLPTSTFHLATHTTTTCPQPRKRKQKQQPQRPQSSLSSMPYVNKAEWIRRLQEMGEDQETSSVRPLKAKLKEMVAASHKKKSEFRDYLKKEGAIVGHNDSVVRLATRSRRSSSPRMTRLGLGKFGSQTVAEVWEHRQSYM